MRSTTLAGAVALLTLSLATLCVAQGDSAATSRLCWRGRPLSQCDAFWITEFGVDASLSSTRTSVSPEYAGGDGYRYAIPDFESRFVWTVGPMFNIRPRAALGGTLSISPFGGHDRVAVEARRRWWTTNGLALDLSAGALQTGISTPTGNSYHNEYGFTVGGFIVGEDLINVNGRVDLLVTGHKPRLGTSIGLGGGSYVAVVGTLALGLLLLAFISVGPVD